MKSLLSLVLFLIAFVAPSHVASAGELGDAAAPLQIAEWIKGKPVDLAAGKGKQVYVIEFWATWCPPCRASIPHLTELQKKFKDVVFIGISDEALVTVKRFVEKMGDKMDYTVALDKDRETSAGYMGAFGIRGIPHAFIVDKEGRIAWTGHPMDNLEKALEEVVAGKFDLGKAKKRAAAQKKVEEFMEAASHDPEDPKLKAMGQAIEALDAELGGIQPGEKFSAAEVLKRFKFEGLMREYELAVKSGKDQADLEKKLEANAPKDFDLAEFKAGVTFSKLSGDYLHAAAGEGDAKQLAELTTQLAAVKLKSPRSWLQTAWAIMEEKSLKTRDYDFAAKLAKTAVDATGSKDFSALFVYARTLFEGGKVEAAITWQKKAILAAGENQDARKELEGMLQKYQAKLAVK